MRVLAVRELERAIEHRRKGLREAFVTTEPRGNGTVVGRGRRKRTRGQLATRGVDHIPLSKFRQHPVVVSGSANGDHVLVVFCSSTEHGGAADVDLLDDVVPADIQAGHRLLEGVEIDADEVDRRDPMGLEVGDVLGDIASGKNPTVHGRMERDNAMTEHLGEAGQLLERRHGDALVGEESSGAATR